MPARAGIPCGVGEQCDGQGACRPSGLGRVAAGSTFTCAVLDDGNVRCWGDNSSGQLGTAFDRARVGDDETPASLGEALELDFERRVVQISAGFAHTCVLFELDVDVPEPNVRCWGQVIDHPTYGTVEGLLGTSVVGRTVGFVDPQNTRHVQLPEPAVQISAASGGAHTCAVLVSGKVACWGLNDLGQCGVGSSDRDVGVIENEVLATVVLDPADPDARALQVAAGNSHTCALLSGGRVTCWGAGDFGQLGYGEIGNRLAPQGSVAIGEPALQISAGFHQTCALLERGRVRCWGNNAEGALGYGHSINIGDDETPEQALSLPRDPGNPERGFIGGDALIGGGGVAQITPLIDSRSVCARFASGSVRCWGENDDGQLGYGHTQANGYRLSPESLWNYPVTGPALPDGGVLYEGGDVPLGGFAVALADSGRCALVRPHGSSSEAPLSLYCWGDNEFGQLGLPEFIPNGSANNTPLQMGPVNWQ